MQDGVHKNVSRITVSQLVKVKVNFRLDERILPEIEQYVQRRKSEGKSDYSQSEFLREACIQKLYYEEQDIEKIMNLLKKAMIENINDSDFQRALVKMMSLGFISASESNSFDPLKVIGGINPEALSEAFKMFEKLGKKQSLFDYSEEE